MRRELRGKNFLDFVPVRNPAYPWRQTEDGSVSITVPHRGFYAAVAQRFFHRPTQSEIALDEYGSFLWLRMDGNTSLLKLSIALEAEFSTAAYPLFNRLAAYCNTLRGYRFITLILD